MKQLLQLLRDAERSPIRLWLLNRIAARSIPFNAPHGIRILSISPTGIRSLLPYRRRNLNHLKGLHACSLATLGEFTAGMSLLHALQSADFRLIMKEIRVTYHRQGKSDATADCRIEADWLRQQVIVPLQLSDAVFVPITVAVSDASGASLCTVEVQWQVKRWDKVRTQP
jgi:acyl-coenzyme A thioesterase PaaI-like protein